MIAIKLLEGDSRLYFGMIYNFEVTTDLRINLTIDVWEA